MNEYGAVDNTRLEYPKQDAAAAAGTHDIVDLLTTTFLYYFIQLLEHVIFA